MKRSMLDTEFLVDIVSEHVLTQASLTFCLQIFQVLDSLVGGQMELTGPISRDFGSVPRFSQYIKVAIQRGCLDIFLGCG